MRKIMIATAAALALGTLPALAGGFGAGFHGEGMSFSGAGNLSGAFEFGSAIATAESQSFGKAESGFGIGIGTMPDGTPASEAYGSFVGASVTSGSMSQAHTRVNGTGFAGAGTIGGGFGSTTLSGGINF